MNYQKTQSHEGLELFLLAAPFLQAADIWTHRSLGEDSSTALISHLPLPTLLPISPALAVLSWCCWS